MAKTKTVFFCTSCGYESSKWMGQCPGCREWNTFSEEPVKITKSGSAASSKYSGTASEPVLLKDISVDEAERISSGSAEFDRVLGGGIVAGSLVLIGGDPGIGKSTLLLQVAGDISASGRKILYVSGEESLKQIKMRADRLGKDYREMLLLCETDLDAIEESILKIKPDIVIIDSIQTMYKEDVGSAPGSVTQVREATALLMQIAKQNAITVFIVGHVTKEGAVAGPRVLEHMVDTVLYFEGDRHASYRLLRAVKNRFGSTDEIGVFEMKEEGLAEVMDPSSFMLSGRAEGASGSVVTCAIEGTRPIMIEVQALVSKSAFGMPRRQATGMDYNRVNLLMAVIEKRGGLQIADQDAYINIAGGIKINEPAMDLATVMSIVSSFKNKALDAKTVIFGEVGLSGEVRAVSRAESRVREAAKLGFTTCVLPAANIDASLKKIKGITLIGVKDIGEAKNVIV